MASLYPNNIDALPTTHADNVNEIIHAQTDNDQSDAINHIETELGILPKGIYASVKARLDRLEYVTLNSVNAASYTLQYPQDQTACIQMLFATASTLIIPDNATAAFPIGTVIPVRQGSAAGQVTVQGASGVTVKEVNNSFQTQGPTAWIYLIKVNTNAWDITGATA